MPQASDELPPYRVRRNAKSRSVRLRMSPRGELTVVVPTAYPLSRVDAFVRDNLGWIESTRRRLTPEATALPERLDFRAAGEAHAVEYAHRPGARPRLSSAPGRLLVACDTDDREAVRALLLAFCRQRALTLLPPMLRSVEHTLGLRCSGVGVRHQRTRWGSCSSTGNISLNQKLLFLTPDLARYVMLHELCHLRHLNHSPAFHALVAAHEPDVARLEMGLTRADELVPALLR